MIIVRTLLETHRTLFRISEEFQHVVSSDVLLKPTALQVFGVISVPRLFRSYSRYIQLKQREKKDSLCFTHNCERIIFGCPLTSVTKLFRLNS